MDIGARLREARESRGLTLDALSRSTRVQPRVLSAIERNDSSSLPPRPYGRGFVRVFATEVGLDPDATVREFFSQFGVAETVPTYHVQDPSIEAVRSAEPQVWVWPVAAVLSYVLVGALVIFAGRWAIQRSSETSAVGTTGSAVPAVAPSAERQPAAGCVTNAGSSADDWHRRHARCAKRFVDHREHRRRTHALPHAPARRTGASRRRPSGQHSDRRCGCGPLAGQRLNRSTHGTARRGQDGRHHA